MKKRMLLAAICSVILSVGIANAQPREGRSSGHTRSEIHHSQAPAPKPIAKVNHKPAPVPPPPQAPRHHADHGHHASCAYCISHRPAPVPPPPAPRKVVYAASPVTTAATVAGVAVVAGLLGAAIASK